MLIPIFMYIKHQQRKILSRLRMLDQIFIKGLANLALETTPYIRVDIRRLLLVLLALKPLSNTFEVNILHRPDALAGIDNWIFNRVILWRQANAALNLFHLVLLISELTILTSTAFEHLVEGEVGVLGFVLTLESVEVVDLTFVL